MANISTIKVGSTTYGITATPTAHASTATTYGTATASKYGHVKLSDSYKTSGGAAASGIGASSAAVYNAYNTLNSNKIQIKTVKCPGGSSSGPTTTTIATNLNKGMLILPSTYGGNGIYIITSTSSMYALYKSVTNAQITPTFSSGTLTITNGYSVLTAFLIY